MSASLSNVGDVAEGLSAAQARRVALAAQGFSSARSSRAQGFSSARSSRAQGSTVERPGAASERRLRTAIGRLGLLQIDSVNVFERSHYLPLFARLGAYDRAVLDRLLFTPTHPSSTGGFLELWAHEAAFVPAEDWPLFRFRHDSFREGKRAWWEQSWRDEHASIVDWLLDEVRQSGPLAASEIEHDANVRRGPWWGWSDVKIALEILFRSGELVSAGRRRFERRYALPEHVLPTAVLDRVVGVEESHLELMRRGLRAHGVGTVKDVADYYRLRDSRLAAAAMQALVDSGEAVPVAVEGWQTRAGRPEKAYLWHEATVPRTVSATAILSPFDPVVWERSRLERVFGMNYRIEIYTPAPKRVYGYYTLPILVDSEIVGRIDLKSDRQRGVLRVQTAWVESGREAETGAIAERLAPVLAEAAAWQGLEGVEISETARGTLVAALTAAVRWRA